VGLAEAGKVNGARDKIPATLQAGMVTLDGRILQFFPTFK
jgi:hypothetical protein